jgi:transcriptional regulator with XRE-family HTH domain
MSPKPFAHVLTLALSRSGRSDGQFARNAGLAPSTLSSYKLGRNFPSPENIAKILGQFRARPSAYHQVLSSYLLDCAPTGYRADLAKLLEGQDFLEARQEVAELDATPQTPQEAALDAALARILQRSRQKKHVRDLLLILGRSPIRLKSGT